MKPPAYDIVWSWIERLPRIVSRGNKRLKREYVWRALYNIAVEKFGQDAVGDISLYFAEMQKLSPSTVWRSRGKKPRRTMHYHSFEDCLAEASKHQTARAWERASPSTYDAASRHGWRDEIYKRAGIQVRKAHPAGYWTMDKALASARKYQSYSEWDKHDRPALRAAHRHGWMIECTAHMKPPSSPEPKYTFEQCQAIGSRFASQQEWKEQDLESYRFARNKSWVRLCNKHMYTQPTLKECQKAALNYRNHLSWRTTDPRTFNVAKKNGWLPYCCGHMGRKPKYSLEECMADAKKYPSRKQWRRHSERMFSAAKRHGWLDLCLPAQPVQPKKVRPKKENRKRRRSPGRRNVTKVVELQVLPM